MAVPTGISPGINTTGEDPWFTTPPSDDKYDFSEPRDIEGDLRWGAQKGFGFFDKPLEDQAKWLLPAINRASDLATPFMNYLPANIRAADRFFSGDVSPVTNEFFKPQEMDFIKKIAQQELSRNKDYIEYSDWRSGENKGRAEWSMLEHPDPDPWNIAGLLSKVRNPGSIMQTTIGGAGGYYPGYEAKSDMSLNRDPIHHPGLGIINKAVGPTGRYNEPHLTLRDVWDMDPDRQPQARTPVYQALLNAAEHLTTTQGSQYGFPIDLDLGLASDYEIPYMRLGPWNYDTESRGGENYELQDWENQSSDWYTPRYPTKEAPPAVTWGEGNILQRARKPNLSAVSQALTPYEVMSGSGYDSFSKTNEANQKYIQEALKHIDAGESEQEEQVQEIERKPREERSSVEEQVVVASKVRKALDNAAKGRKVKNEFQAITELAKTDPTIARRYTTPGSQDLIDITSQVESFASINKPRPGYGKPPRRPGGR